MLQIIIWAGTYVISVHYPSRSTLDNTKIKHDNLFVQCIIHGEQVFLSNVKSFKSKLNIRISFIDEPSDV